MNELRKANVTVLVPLAVRMKTAAAGSSTPVDQVDTSLTTGSWSVGDEVLVTFNDNKLIVLHHLGPA